jgi:hypothetical protein
MDKHVQFLVIIYHKGDIWIKVCHSLIPTLLSTVYLGVIGGIKLYDPVNFGDVQTPSSHVSTK